MIAGIHIRIDDRGSAPLAEFIAANTPARVAGRIGPAMRDLTREHLGALPSTSGFYEKFADGVIWLPSDTGLEVLIPPAVDAHTGRVFGLGLRVFGGTIHAQTVDNIAIPIDPVSRDHVPSDFPGLFLVKTAKGAFLCQYQKQISEKTGRQIGRRGLGGHAGKRDGGQEIIFLFKLQPSVTQAGDRKVLPSAAEYLRTAETAALN